MMRRVSENCIHGLLRENAPLLPVNSQMLIKYTYQKIIIDQVLGEVDAF